MRIVKFNFKIVILIITTFLILFYISYHIIEYKTDQLKIDRYNEVATSMQEQVKTYIAEKQNAVSYISIAMSKNSDIKKAITTNNYKEIDLQEIALDFKKNTNLQSLMFHIITKDGISFLKSWTPMRGESILPVRADIRKNLKEQKILNTISVGKFNMTFKSIVPIFYQGKFIGFFETLAKFNSIILNMEAQNYETIVLVDKSYKKQLTQVEKRYFIDDYFVVNEHLQEKEEKYITSIGVDSFINNNNKENNKYIVCDKLNKLETMYVLNDLNGKPMAYFSIFYPLDKINMKDIDEIQTNLLGMSFTALLFLGWIMYYIYIKRYSSVIEQLNTELMEKNQVAAKLNRELEESEHELALINENLEQTIKDEVEKNNAIQQRLFKSEKMASMGEMIGNIAHQWRQPLSVIATGATGLKMKKEYGILSDESLLQICDLINDNAQYLSKTIDDFRNFIKGESTKQIFDLEENINSFLSLVNGSLKSHNINVILELEQNIKINGYDNELVQCYINIFNNAKDALDEQSIEDKFFFINTYKEDDKVTIKFKDNAGGVAEDIIDKIFEPYFTTKHQSKGTGLGLHMTYQLIVEGMDGQIEVKNVEYEYDSKSYKGAEFSITLKTDIV